MRKYQWAACVVLILFLIAAVMLLTERHKQRSEDGTFVLERTWNNECLYQGRGERAGQPRGSED